MDVQNIYLMLDYVNQLLSEDEKQNETLTYIFLCKYSVH